MRVVGVGFAPRGVVLVVRVTIFGDQRVAVYHPGGASRRRLVRVLIHRRAHWIPKGEGASVVWALLPGAAHWTEGVTP